MSEKMRIVFIGNSIVNGFPYDRNNDFVSLYRDSTGYDVINKGINGDTVNGVMRRFSEDVLSYKPDMVVIMTGTNEFIYKELLPEQCMNNIMNLVNLARNEGIEPVLLTPIPVEPKMAKNSWVVCGNVDYEIVQEQIIQLKNLLIRCGEQNNIKIIDTNFAYSRYVDLVGEQLAYFDGIHPTREGHKLLAEVVGRFI